MVLSLRTVLSFFYKLCIIYYFVDRGLLTRPFDENFDLVLADQIGQDADNGEIGRPGRQWSRGAPPVTE